ncbi:MAG: bifunctional oligoribonuclease/PAP phosphatase NrnA [Bacteroidales bacterium]|nr:bifunctional oligoribonuclease/PAP phosphatase NrnA [Bacteroidales bacterium]
MVLSLDAIDNFSTLVNEHQVFVLTCHTNADGDALGSTLALRKALVNMGKKATVVTPDLPPTYFSWMPGFKTIRTYEKETELCNSIVDEAEVIVVLDYSDIRRVKTLGDKLASVTGKKSIMIDHHLDPIFKADVSFSFPEACATCDLLFTILRKSSLAPFVDVDVATCIYTGILTDTGGLSYNSSDPEIYLTVAELLRMGIDKPTIHDNVFNNKTVRRLKLLGYTLNRKLHRIEKYPLSIMTLDAKELEQYGYHTGDTEGFVNYPLQVKDIIATAFIMERPDGVKISLRSKGNFPVNEFAARYYSGGGHLNAAGGNFSGTFEEAVNTYNDNIVEFYAKWLKQQSK